MSEKFNFSSQEDRSDAVDATKDFVDVDVKGKAHIPKGSGSKSGRFMSDHELTMIEAHSEQIHEGIDNKESESILEAVGILTDPADIRDSLYVHGFLDEDEVEDWSDAEVMEYVADTQKNVENYYGTEKPSEEYVGKRRKDVSVDAEKEAEEEFTFGRQVTVQRTSGDIEDDWKVRSSDESTVEVVKDAPEGGLLVKSISRDELTKLNYVPKHRAEHSDEDSPVFEELKNKQETAGAEAREGESQEEYEARQLEMVGGKHAAKSGELSADDLELIGEGDASESLSADDLELIGTDNETESAPQKRSWRERLRALATPAGLAAEASAWAYTRREKRERNDSKRSKAKIGLGILGLGLAGAIIAHKTGHHFGGGSGSGGNTLQDILDKKPEGSGGGHGGGREAIDSIGDNTTSGNGNGGQHETWKFADGSGGEALMNDHGIDPAVWYEHQDEFLKQFPDLSYRMSDGNVGLLDQNAATGSSKLPQAAQEWWKNRS